MSCAGLAECHPVVAQAESPTNRSQPRPASEGLLSEDRSPRAKEPREAQDRGGAPRAEAKKHREEWEKLSPEERRAAFREWRQKRQGEGKLSAPEREARRRVMRERFARQLGELRQKQADSDLTEEERNRLERLEEIARRFEREGSTNAGSNSRRPGETLPKPDRNSENSAPSRAPHP